MEHASGDEGYTFESCRPHSSVTIARTRTVNCSTVFSDAEQRAQSAIPNAPAYRSSSGGFRHLTHQRDPYCHFIVGDLGAAGASLHRTVEAAKYWMLANWPEKGRSLPLLRESLHSLSGAFYWSTPDAASVFARTAHTGVAQGDLSEPL